MKDETSSLTGALPLGPAARSRFPSERRTPGKAQAASSRARPRTTSRTSTSTFPLGLLRRGDRRLGRGQVHARQRHPLPRPGAHALRLARGRRASTRRSTASSTSTRSSTSTSSPIGRTPRSNPATYTKVFDSIRDVSRRRPRRARTATRRAASRFNVKGGRCEACEGDGVQAGRDALPRRRATCPARSATASASTTPRCACATRARTSPRCST